MITLAHAAEISKRCTDSLREDFQQRVLAWYHDCYQAGINVYIYEGLRSMERQDELYAKGRTESGSIVTHAKAGQSFHNYALAFDWVPLVRTSKAQDLYEASWDFKDAYNMGQAIGKKFGLRAMSWETPHLEDDTYRDWHELKAKFGNE